MSARKFRIRASARRDLDAYTDYLIAKAGKDTARRFIDNGQATFAGLAANPGIGSPVASRLPVLAGLRKWRVEGFPKLLIFYIPSDTEISIVRVLHAAQDWWSLLDVD